jgi:hypothetical protein
VLNNGVGGAVQSRHAQLTVTADNQGPQVVSVVSVGGPNNEIVITFNEAVDDASASDAFEYSMRLSQDGSPLHWHHFGPARYTTDFAVVRL